MFKNNNICVIIFPSHMTHIIQQFDQVIAKQLKTALGQVARHILNDIDDNGKHQSKTIRYVQIQALIDAHRVAITQEKCRIAFDICGLFPRNQGKVISNKLIKKSAYKLHHS